MDKKWVQRKLFETGIPNNFSTLCIELMTSIHFKIQPCFLSLNFWIQLQWFVFILLGRKICVHFAFKTDNISNFHSTYKCNMSAWWCPFFAIYFSSTAPMNQSNGLHSRVALSLVCHYVRIRMYSWDVCSVDSHISFNICIHNMIFRFSLHICSLFWSFHLPILVSADAFILIKFPVNPTAFQAYQTAANFLVGFISSILI